MQDDLRSPVAAKKVRKPTPLYVPDLRRFKGFARKLQVRSPGNKGSVLLEWASSVSDLHRILDVTKSLFLISQSHNEILLRVGLELATSKIAWKIFEWTDGDWYADDARREWFRDIVQTNLTQVLETASGERAEDEKLANANQKVRDVQSELEVAEEKCKAAEALVAQTQGQLQNLECAFEHKSEDLLQTQDQLRDAQVKLDEARANITAIEAKLRKTRKAADAMESDLRDADARCLELEEDLMKHKADLKEAQAGNQSELNKESEQCAKKSASKFNSSEARAQTADATQRQMLTELERNTAELDTWIGACNAAKAQAAELHTVVDKLQDEVTMLQAGTLAEGGAHSDSADLERALLDLNSKFVKLAGENDKLRCQLNTAQAAIASCESRIRPSTVDGGMQTSPKAKSLCGVSGNKGKRVPEEAGHPNDDELRATLEKTRNSLKKLEEENVQLKKALDGLHTNLKTVVNTCRESGVALQVVEAIDTYELRKDSKGPAGVVWDRLYGDAMERIHRTERCREASASPERRCMSATRRHMMSGSEQDCNVTMSPPRVHVHAADQLESHRSSDDALGADLPFAPASTAPKSWSLPPCSASRQVRCGSAHRLRVSRQATRGRASSTNSPKKNMASTCGFSQRSDEFDLLSPCRSKSPQKKKEEKTLEKSVSLPFLHGYKLPSWQGGSGL